jgi:hypothetical protein
VQSFRTKHFTAGAKTAQFNFDKMALFFALASPAMVFANSIMFDVPAFWYVML